MSLLTRLGAAAGSKLKPESWRYTSLRALDAQAQNLQPGNLREGASAAMRSLGNSEWISTSAVVPIAEALNCRSANPQRSIFADLAGQSACFVQELSGTHYFLLEPAKDYALVQQQHHLSVPAGAKALCIWHHDGSASNSFCNFLTRIDVAAGAQLTMIRLQNTQSSSALIERTEITVAQNATFKLLDVSLGAKLARHDLQICLAGSMAAGEVSLLSVLDAQQVIDTQLEVQHLSAACTSQTRVKSVATGRARSVFNGRIYVAPGADGTDAQLRTNNLLLSEHAEIDAKPELEIHAEEVSCSHGATVGQLDEQALFYLSTRGIAREQAKQILTQAFCQALIDQLELPELREWLTSMVETKLPKASTP